MSPALRVIVLIGDEPVARKLGRLIKEGHYSDGTVFVSTNLTPSQIESECKRGKAVVARVRTANHRKFVSSLSSKYDVSAWLVRLPSSHESLEENDFSAVEMAAFSKIIVVNDIKELDGIAKEIQRALHAQPIKVKPSPPVFVCTSSVKKDLQKSDVRKALQAKFGVLNSFFLQRGVLKVSFEHEQGTNNVDVAVGDEVLHLALGNEKQRVTIAEHTVVVKNLAVDVSAKDVKSLFVQFDDKVKVKISRCVATVSFSTKEALDQCLLQNIVLNGVALQVTPVEAVPAKRVISTPTEEPLKDAAAPAKRVISTPTEEPLKDAAAPAKRTISTPTEEPLKDAAAPTKRTISTPTEEPLKDAAAPAKRKARSKPLQQTLVLPPPPPNKCGVVVRGVTENDQAELFACIHPFGEVSSFIFTYRSCKLAFATPQQAKELLTNPPMFRDAPLNMKVWNK